MRVTSRTAAALAIGTLSLACISEPAGPTLGTAFATSAASYSLTTTGNFQSVQIAYVYQDRTGNITALQGCTGGATRWFLEKQVNNVWQEVYPVCTPNDAEGRPVAGNASYASTVTIVDGLPEGSSPRISARPIAGTYRLRFGLFEDLNFVTGVGVPVTDGRRYSNTFTLQ